MVIVIACTFKKVDVPLLYTYMKYQYISSKPSHHISVKRMHQHNNSNRVKTSRMKQDEAGGRVSGPVSETKIQL